MTSNTRAPQVLDGVRVLDLGSFITAPYAAMLLAEMGADVVKVERPGGGRPVSRLQWGALQFSLSSAQPQ